jgi:hypothetical protein
MVLVIFGSCGGELLMDKKVKKYLGSNTNLVVLNQ